MGEGGLGKGGLGEGGLGEEGLVEGGLIEGGLGEGGLEEGSLGEGGLGNSGNFPNIWKTPFVSDELKSLQRFCNNTPYIYNDSCWDRIWTRRVSILQIFNNIMHMSFIYSFECHYV